VQRPAALATLVLRRLLRRRATAAGTAATVRPDSVIARRAAATASFVLPSPR